jgi:hypothetical protein
MTPTVVIGQEVGLGFDPDWIKARMQGQVQGEKREMGQLGGVS